MDLNLRSADATRHGVAGADFVPSMRPAWDPDGLLDAARETIPSHSPHEARAHRYLVAHSIAKILQLRDDATTARLAIAAESSQFLRAALLARGEAYPGNIRALQRLAVELPELLTLLERAILDPGTCDAPLYEAAKLALDPIGGAWKPGEILVVGWDRRTNPETERAISSVLGPILELSDPPQTFR